MKGENLIEILQLAGSIAGAITAITAFVTVVIKKPKMWIQNTIRAESKAANQQLEEDVKSLIKESEDSKKRDLVSIRHSITSVYEQYSRDKKLPTHIKEDLFSLLEEYDKLGGNSYVHALFEEMKTWDVE